jgi:hypothetical protein
MRFRIGLLMILALLLAGCSGSGNSALPLSAASTDGSVRVNYPDGWISRTGEGVITLATSSDALDDTQRIATGGLVVVVSRPPQELIAQYATQNGIPFSSNPSAYEVLSIMGIIASQDGTTTVNEITSMAIGDRNVARAHLTAGPNATARAGDGLLMMIDMGNGFFVMVTALAPVGELEQNEATILAITDSIQFSP